MNYNERDTSYPSPAEVKIFIGQNWVDDVYRIDYTVTTNRIPLYDYTSRFFKDVAEGNSIVQGQIIINYRFPNYLMHVIKETKATLDPQIKNDFNNAGQMFRDLSEGNAEQKVRRLIEMQRNGNLKNAKTIAPILHGDNSQVSSDINPVISQYEITPFDILISYNGDDQKYSHKISDVILLGESQVISASAIAGGDLSASSMPIYEIYSFFAKKVTPIINRK